MFGQANAETPPPGEESGRIDTTGDTPASPGRTVGRVVLFVPRFALDAALSPFRVATWLYERYQLKTRWKRTFFNDAETIGLYPLLHLDSLYGVNIGARFVHRDMFGSQEHLSIRADAGGRFQQRYLVDLRSGRAFGERVLLHARGELERRPHDAYYGVGNHAMAVATRHRQQLERGWVSADVRAVGSLHVRGTAALTDLEYGPGDTGTSIESMYEPAMLTGFESGIRHVYGELELRWDSRRRASAWDVSSIPATGWLLAGYGGRVHQLDAGSDYSRVGVDLQRFIWLGRGPRVLALRLHGEAVTGGYDDVAFTELPQLGGKHLLRGYPIDRFRDRAAGLGSVEYMWDLNRNVEISLFVDAGQVLSSVTDTPDRMRVGYGVGMQAVTGSDVIATASLASSIDGGVFVNLAFDPAFDIDPRVVQR